MRKKYLSALLFGALVMASTVTFTSCIDNDEPAGIENLRGAKAELLRAKVAVEQADAAYKLAQAEHEKANATYRLAEARWMEAEAKKKEAEAAQAEAKTEADKAYYEKMIAQYKQEMEVAAETHKATMLEKQRIYAEAVRAYEIAMKEIEIAKALMSDQVRVSISSLQEIIEGFDYYDSDTNTSIHVDGLKDKLDDAISEVESKEKALYEAMLEKAGSFVDWSDTSADFDNNYYIPELEANLTEKQAALTTAKEKVEMWKSFLEMDATTTDWSKEIVALEDSIKGIVSEEQLYQVELTKLQESDEYKNAKYTATMGALGHAYKYVYKFNNTQSGLNADNSAKFELSAATILKDYTDGSGVSQKGAKTKIEDEIKKLEGSSFLGKYSTQYIALLKEYADNAEGAVKDATDAYTKAKEAWTKALKAYNDAKAYNETSAINTLKGTITFDNLAKAINGTDEEKLAAKNAIAGALKTYYTNAAIVDLKTNEIELTISVGGSSSNVKKTVLAWLSDATYAGTYLNALINNVSGIAWPTPSAITGATTDAAKAAIVDNFVSTLTTANANGFVASVSTVDNKLIALQNASNAAFGTQLLTEDAIEYGYMRVEPTEAEVKAVTNYWSSCGKAGEYYKAIAPETAFEAKNYEDIIADYTAAVTSLKEELAVVKAAIKANEAAWKVFEDQETAINAKSAPLTARSTSLNTIKNELIKLVNTYLEGNDKFITTPGAASFTEQLKSKVTAAESEVIKAEKAVAKAEVYLQEAKDGKYDEVAVAQKALDAANEELQAAQAAYDKAVADLQTALKIMAQSAE